MMAKIALTSVVKPPDFIHLLESPSSLFHSLADGGVCWISKAGQEQKSESLWHNNQLSAFFKSHSCLPWLQREKNPLLLCANKLVWCPGGNAPAAEPQGLHS